MNAFFEGGVLPRMNDTAEHRENRIFLLSICVDVAVIKN
jgi:hypothetical protein